MPDVHPRRLLIFAKYPHAGDVKTRLVPPLTYERAAMLYRAFLLDALDLYASLRPAVEPVLYLAGAGDVEPMRAMLRGTVNDAIDIRVQFGATLGERLERAFCEAFEEGCSAACAIGTDHPTLPLDHVRLAFGSLRGHDVVIGPADDGGYYLLALAEPRPRLFAGMPYSTSALYDAVLSAIHECGLRLHELPVWYDVDDAASLRRLIGDRALLPPDSRTLRVIAEIGCEPGEDPPAA